MSDRMVVCPNCDCQGVYPRYVYGKAKTKVSILKLLRLNVNGRYVQ